MTPINFPTGTVLLMNIVDANEKIVKGLKDGTNTISK